MKKTYIEPTIKTIKVRTEGHIAQLSGGGNDNASGTINQDITGNGEDALGKDELDFGW